MKLIIEDDEGRKTVVPFVREEITIGRQEGNTIRLTERNVSRRHARLFRQNGHVQVEDLNSYNGIRLNGEKIQGTAEIADGDLIQIGDYDLAIDSEAAAHSEPPPEAADEPETELDHSAVGDAEATTPSASPRHEETAIIRMDQLEANKPRAITELDAAHAPRLVVLNTELAGREFSCLRSEVKIGRTEENDISLDHRSLSRTHAKLVLEPSGEWKVFDLRSANGITVNGEGYTKATLNHGDVLELGHVKLRFVAAGEKFQFVPGDERPLGAKRKLPVPLLAGAGAGLLVVGAVGFWALAPAKTPPPAPEPAPIAHAEPAPAPAPAAVVAPAPEAHPEPAAPDFSKELSQAKASMAARKFEAAIPVLSGLKDESGQLVPDAQALLDEATAEIAAKKAIAQAAKDVSGGKLEAAAALLDQADGTVAYADDLQKVRARLDSATAAKERASAKAATKPVKPVAAVRPAPAQTSEADEARKNFEDGTLLFKKRQFREAKVFFQKCLEADPGFARCHMMLGSTFARLNNAEEGAKHYRQFVQLAPADDADALKVKKFLEEYEASKSNP